MAAGGRASFLLREPEHGGAAREAASTRDRAVARDHAAPAVRHLARAALAAQLQHPLLPYALDTNDMKLWQAPALTPAQWAEYAIESYECMRRGKPERAQLLSIGVHLRIIGRPGRIGALARVIEHIRAGGDAWIATRQEIAAHFARCVPLPPPGVAAAQSGRPSS